MAAFFSLTEGCGDINIMMPPYAETSGIFEALIVIMRLIDNGYENLRPLSMSFFMKQMINEMRKRGTKNGSA